MRGLSHGHSNQKHPSFPERISPSQYVLPVAVELQQAEDPSRFVWQVAVELQ
jgi:hypothetical protein